MLAEQNCAFNSWGVFQHALRVSAYHASSGAWEFVYFEDESQNSLNVLFDITLMPQVYSDTNMGSMVYLKKNQVVYLSLG